MDFPIRCFTCGKVINHMYTNYTEAENKKEFLDGNGIKRYCCRRMFLTHVSHKDEVLAHSTLLMNTGNATTRVMRAK